MMKNYGIFTIFIIVFFSIGILFYMNQRSFLPEMSYADRYIYITNNQNKINRSLSHGYRNKNEIIEKIGLPYNNPQENCWIWIPPSDLENIGKNLVEYDFGSGGFFLCFKSEGMHPIKIRSIAGNWELFQKIIERETSKE